MIRGGALLLAALAGAQERPPLWGDLSPGPCAVGFEASVEIDAARAQRPLLVNLWYPAADDDRDGDRMRHGDYFDALPDEVAGDPSLSRFVTALVAYEHDVVATELFGAPAAKLGPKEGAQLAEFLATGTACIRDAAPRRERCPLVVYHAGYGSSFDDDAVLCEFLASHGYVVVGSAYQQADGAGFNVDAHDGSARDVDFLIALLSARGDVDAARVAMIGHSGGAHAALRQQSREGSRLRAVVSLDTTQDYYSNADPRWNDLTQPVLGHVDRMAVPLLFCAQPHASFELADRLVAADRWYFTANLDHEEWIAQGVLRAELAARRAPDDLLAVAGAKRIRADYTTLARFVFDFLDAQLKGRELALEHLATQYRDLQLGLAPHVEFAAKGTGAPPAPPLDAARLPTPRELRPLLAQHGAPAVAALLRRMHASAGTAGAATIYHRICGFGVVYELADQGREDDARTLGRAWRDCVPDLLDSFVAIGEFSGRRGNRDFGRKCLATALVIDPEHAAARSALAALGKE